MVTRIFVSTVLIAEVVNARGHIMVKSRIPRSGSVRGRKRVRYLMTIWTKFSQDIHERPYRREVSIRYGGLGVDQKWDRRSIHGA